MKYLELSLKKLRNVSIEAANQISNEHDIDIIIYVAKAGYPIASYMNEVFKAQLLGISAHRKGNKLKSIVGPVVAYMPRFIRNAIITVELKSKIHKRDTERHVEFHKSVEHFDLTKKWEILIVDDSIDTGNSMKLVFDEVQKKFPNATIYTYGLNVWEKSKAVFITDYHSFEETVIKAPMSKDSREYKHFIQMYESGSKNEYI